MWTLDAPQFCFRLDDKLQGGRLAVFHVNNMAGVTCDEFAFQMTGSICCNAQFLLILANERSLGGRARRRKAVIGASCEQGTHV